MRTLRASLASLPARFIYNSHPAILALSLLLLLWLKTGIWVMPNLDVSRQIAQNPFAASEQIYLASNWLHLALAWLAGASASMAGFAAFHLAFSLGFLGLFYWWCRRELSDHDARTALVLMACLPVSGTSFYWLGMDSVTLFLLMLALTTRQHPVAAALAGLALGMQHFEQAMVAQIALAVFIGLNLRLQSENRYHFAWLFALAAGTLAGKGLLTALLHHFEIVIIGERIAFLQDNWPKMMQSLAGNLHSVLWTLMATGWIVVLQYVRHANRLAPFAFSFLMLLGVLLLVEDQTRVFAIVSFPLLAAAWLFNTRFLSGLSPRFVSAVLLVWLLVPWHWSWRGIPYRSALPYDFAMLTGLLFNWPAIPTPWLMWPFH